MFQLQPTPKQSAKLKIQNSNHFEVPHDWEDFCKHLEINNGGRIEPMKVWDFQKQVSHLLDLYPKVLFVKSRQISISTICLTKILHWAAQERGFNCLAFSKRQEDSSLLASRARDYVKNSPWSKLQSDNLKDLWLTNGGRIRFMNSRPDAARSQEAVGLLWFDESAFIEELAAIREASLPTQSTVKTAREWHTSTPNFKSGAYYELLNNGNGNRNIEEICNDIVTGKLPPLYWFIDESGWCKIFLNWRIHDKFGKNPNFLNELQASTKSDWATIKREYELDFSSPEAAYFNQIDIATAKVQKGSLKQSTATPKDIYIVGIDPASIGEDYCIASVLHLSDRRGKKVWNRVNMYRARGQSMEKNLDEILRLIGKFEKGEMVVGIETNSIGQNYYEEILRRKPFLMLKPIRTSQESKLRMCGKLRYVLEQGRYKFEEGDPIEKELQNFRQRDNELAASSGHDDIVLADSIALEAASLEALY